MKNLKLLLAVGSFAVLSSCGTTKETPQTTQTPEKPAIEQQANRGRSNRDNIADKEKTRNSADFPSGEESTVNSVRNDKTRDNARMQEMYSALNMNEDQIKRFENEWERSSGNWKRSNRNKTMNNFERVEYQDRILKNILDEAQFDAYQEWARSNPARD